MKTSSSYQSRQPDNRGYVDYPADEHAVWQTLYHRQMQVVPGRACDEYIEGLQRLRLPEDGIPQIPEINRVLDRYTGWQLQPVAALIGFREFFSLLANRRFPVATFIRRREELDYLQEPDIFHEIFGHCPLLTNPAYAAFSQRYGQLALESDSAIRTMLARLYWFTIEFGLVRSARGLRIYGGGILSSFEETLYSLESDRPRRVDLDPLDVLRTPYRIDVLQRIYFIIDSLSQLESLAKLDLIELAAQAQAMGMKPSLYPDKNQVA